MMMKASYIDLTGDFGNDISQIKWAFESMSEGHIIQKKTLAELKEALSLVEDKNFSNGNIVKFSKSIDSIRDSISLHLANELDIIKNATLNALSAIPRILKDELLKILLIPSDKYSDKIRDVLPDESDVYRKIHEQFFSEVKDILKGFSLEKLSEIRDFRGEDFLPSIELVQSTLVEGINKELFILTIRLSEEDIFEIKQNISNKYPSIGKNNFSILRNLKKIEGDYISHTKEKIKNQTMEHARTNSDTYTTFGDAVNDMLVFNASILRNGLMGYYKDFVEEYIDDLFKKISLRKNKSQQTKVLSNNSLSKSEPKTIIYKENKCPQKVVEFLNDFVDSLDVLHKEKSLIRSYILRLYLKGKSIRIKNMIQNFPKTEALFTEEFINQSKEIGLVFENGIHKKNIEDASPGQIDNISEKTNEPKEQLEDETKMVFEQKIDHFIKNTKSFDGNGFVSLMKLAGYGVENDKYLAKTFDKLYKKDCNMKLLFLNDIKQNIYAQEKISHMKECYRKINLHNSYRILFLINNKTIDGIYNHTEYEKRIDSKVF